VRLLSQFVLAAFACICALAASAAPYPNEEQLRLAIENVQWVAEEEGLEVEILDAQKEGITRPLMAAGLSLTRGTCLVFYNTQPLDTLRQFFATFNEEDLAIWLDAIAVHEFTHCVEQRAAYVRKQFDKVLPPGYERDKITIQSYLAVVKSGAVEMWGEALADLAALLYLRQAVPDRWQYFANELAGMRERFAEKYPAHNTGPWLRKAIAADAKVATNQNLFEAAFALRRRFEAEETPKAPSKK